MNKKNYLWISKLMLGIYLIPALMWGAPPKDPPTPPTPPRPGAGTPVNNPKPGLGDSPTSPKGGSQTAPKGGINAPNTLKGGFGSLPTDPAKLGDLINDLIVGKPSSFSDFYKNWTGFTISGTLNNPAFEKMVLDLDLGGRPLGVGGAHYLPLGGIYTFDRIKPYFSPAVLALIKRYGFDTDVTFIIQKTPAPFHNTLASYFRPNARYYKGAIVVYNFGLIAPKQGDWLSVMDMAVFHELMHANIFKWFYQNPDVMEHLEKVLEDFRGHFDYSVMIKKDQMADFNKKLLRLYEEIEIYYREYLIWKTIGKVDPDYHFSSNFSDWVEVEKLGPDILKKEIVTDILMHYEEAYFSDYTDVVTQEAFINAILNSPPPEYVTLTW